MATIDQAESILKRVLKVINSSDCIRARTKEFELEDLSVRCGFRELSVTDSQGVLYIWDVNTISTDSFLLFDIQDEYGNSI